MSAAERTTANSAQKALETRLRAREDLAAALVQIGLPAEDPREDDRIYIASVDDLERGSEPAGLAVGNAKIFEEAYTLTVMIETHRAGSQDDDTLRQETSDRMWAILAELEQDLADDPELADDVDQAYVKAVPTAFTLAAPDGWIAKMVATVQIKALCILG